MSGGINGSDIAWGSDSGAAAWGFTATKGGLKHSNLHNVGVALGHDPTLLGTVWYDEFLDRLLTTGGREWRDEDDVRTAMYLQDTYRMDRVSPSQVRDAVTQRAKLNPRHCVKDWLTSLTWDRVDRIAHAFEDHWGVQTNASQPLDYVRAASANFFIGLVARVLRPGCKLDTMPVFEGAQGIRKSTALEVVGGDWYGISHESVSTKDFFQVLPGKWVVELAELDNISRADVTRVKSVLSTRVDRYRPSYGRSASDHPRQCVFVGTANKDDWGRDETGLRRFWPLRCGEINLATLAETRAQLFAEAVFRFRDGVPWWSMPSSALDVQADRQAESSWFEIIKAWALGKDELTMAEVLRDGLKFEPSKITRIHELEAGRVLRLLGWSRSQRRHEGSNPRRVWRQDVNPTLENSDF